jgi:hypothetical protein
MASPCLPPLYFTASFKHMMRKPAATATTGFCFACHLVHVKIMEQKVQKIIDSSKAYLFIGNK